MARQNESRSTSDSELERDERFIERLRYATDQAGGSTALARSAGLSLGGLQRYLNGSEPTRRKLMQLADAAGVSFNWLATGEGQPEPDTRESEQPHQKQRIDHELLEIIMEVLDEQLAKHNRMIPTDRKAVLISNLYSVLLDARENGAPISNDSGTRAWLNGTLRFAIDHGDTNRQRSAQWGHSRKLRQGESEGSD